MELKIMIESYAGILLLSDRTSNTSVVAGQSAAVNARSATEGISNEEPGVSNAHLDDTIYIGEYLDSDVNEPNLEIARSDDNKYIIRIGVYRLTSLSDGIGELTADGMNFTTAGAAGNPVRGIIIANGQAATITFTDSTQDYPQNGFAFQCTKSSDASSIWNEQTAYRRLN